MSDLLKRMCLALFALVVYIGVYPSVAMNTAPCQETKKSYLYRWTDDRGGVHITDGLGNVPEKYRGRAVVIEQRSAAGDERQATTPARVVPENEYSELNSQADRNAVWRQRMSDARQRLAEATHRLGELDRKRTSLLVRYAPPADVAEAQRIEGEMSELQKKIEDLRYEIDVTIPDGARRDGVPPGLLRE